MEFRPLLLEELTEGLVCEIIDMRASAEIIQSIADAKKHFKRDITPEMVYKSHILSKTDVEYYQLNPELIKRDLRILTDL